MGAGVGPVDVVLGPGDDRHGHEDAEGDWHRVALELGDRLESPRRQVDLQAHDQHHDDDLQPGAGRVVPELADEGEDEVEHDPGVDGAPAGRDQPLHRRREIAAPTAEGASRHDHLADAGLLAHEDEEAEDGHADEVADHQHQDGLPRLRPISMPRAPSTQLIGAMLAPDQIQNWCQRSMCALCRAPAAAWSRPLLRPVVDSRCRTHDLAPPRTPLLAGMATSFLRRKQRTSLKRTCIKTRRHLANGV